MSYAAQQYQKQSGNYLSSREVEAMAFRYVNNLLNNANSPSDRILAISNNKKLWTSLLRDVEQSPLSEILKKDIISLGIWSLKHSNLSLSNSLSLQPLIDINNDMIAGLSAPSASSLSPLS
ncbi:flagellar biosynthesis regulator FlaF [Swingsia samuiensis]|uniref:Flagellin assembly protein n=1 Tax=Swingsia samuiensis TaxID=1293412 RepID=A0A4Y6UM10_9PROT|nr:flagellar biosynthesis regulator FlaF [Swingsia samuiensis]QDH17065.1 flagellin assembly protein [Swingsia samuiensis]